MSEVQKLSRVFKVGATPCPDPAPSMAPEDAVKLLQGTYPHLVHCTLEGPEVVGNQLVYTVVRPPAQTKGARQSMRGRTAMSKRRAEARALPAARGKPLGEAIQAINDWADAPTTASYDETLHESAARFLMACAKRRASALDPFQISLA